MAGGGECTRWSLLHFFSALARVHFFQWIMLLSISIWGCATTEISDWKRIHLVYRDKIKEWEMRIQGEGWSEAQLDSI